MEFEEVFADFVEEFGVVVVPEVLLVVYFVVEVYMDTAVFVEVVCRDCFENAVAEDIAVVVFCAKGRFLLV